MRQPGTPPCSASRPPRRSCRTLRVLGDRVGGAEEGKHGAHAVVVVVGLIEPQLGEYARYVGFDGPGTQAELFCYPEVGAALGHALEHGTLPLVEHVDLAWL